MRLLVVLSTFPSYRLVTFHCSSQVEHKLLCMEQVWPILGSNLRGMLRKCSLNTACTTCSVTKGHSSCKPKQSRSLLPEHWNSYMEYCENYVNNVHTTVNHLGGVCVCVYVCRKEHGEKKKIINSNLRQCNQQSKLSILETKLTSVCGHNPLVRTDPRVMPSHFSSHCT